MTEAHLNDTEPIEYEYCTNCGQEMEVSLISQPQHHLCDECLTEQINQDEFEEMQMIEKINEHFEEFL